MGSATQAAAVVNIAEKAAKLGYFVFDPERKRTRFASEGLKHITNRVFDGQDEVSIEDLFAKVHEKDRNHVMASVAATIERGEPLEIEFRVVCDDGDILHLWLINNEINDPVEGIIRVGIVQDLTEQRRRELVLGENVALKRAIIDSALDGVVIIDDQGIICDFNPTAERLFGYDREDVIGKTLANTIVPTKYRSAHEEGLKRYLNEGTPHVIGQRVEIEAVKKSGEEFPIELTIQQINVGDRLLFTSNIRDISDRREAERRQAEHEAELKCAKEVAESANKAKSEFLASMSHEIRTPLNGVLGVLTLLGDTQLSNEQREFLNTAYGSGQNLLTLISDILDLSKIEAGKMEQEPVDFHPLSVAQEAADLVEAISAQKGLTVSIDANTDLTIVRSDQAQIRQILTNLVSNATKFTHKGSVTICVALHGSKLRYEVRDTGIGIAAPHQARLFKKFSQVDPSTRRRYGGTGLGLSICKELVELLNGEIGFESSEGVGSSFWFEIPVQQAEDTKQAPDINSTTVSEIEISARILLAEDSYTNALVASSFLRAAGARVDIASNGLEVLSATANRQYDLIVMDVSMPELDGIETSEILRRQDGWTKHVPIVALTANASNEDKAQCLKAGMNVFLTKPIERAKLLMTVFRSLYRDVDTDKRTVNSAPSTAAKTEPIFDASTIRNNFGDIPDLFSSVVIAFQSEFHQRITEAITAANDGDMKAVQRTAHALKGAASNVHAGAIVRLSQSLETHAHTGNVDAIGPTIDQLKKMVAQVDTEIPNLPFMDKVS